MRTHSAKKKKARNQRESIKWAAKWHNQYVTTGSGKVAFSFATVIHGYGVLQLITAAGDHATVHWAERADYQMELVSEGSFIKDKVIKRMKGEDLEPDPNKPAPNKHLRKAIQFFERRRRSDTFYPKNQKEHVPTVPFQGKS